MVGADLLDVLEAQPLRGKAGRQRFGSRIGQHALQLLLEHGGRLQRALHGDAHQLGVGHGPPHEERQARGQVEVADAIGLPPQRGCRAGGPGLSGAQGGRGLLHAEEEARAGENGLHRHPHAGFEVALLASALVERHQFLQILGVRRATVGLAGQRADDVAGAAGFLDGTGRPAGEDLAAARRIRDAGHRHRAKDGEVAQVRERRGAEHLADVGIGERVLNRHDQVVGRSFKALHERHRQAMLAGLDVDLRRLHGHAVRVLLVHARVDVHQRHPLAVDRDLDLLTAIRSAEQVAGGAHVQHDLEPVVAVGRKHMQGRQPAAGAERRALDVAHLRRRARHLPGGRARRGVAIAHRQAADLAGRAQVALHQRR